MANFKFKVLMVISILWTVFTLALVSWWMVFTVSQLEKMQIGHTENPAVYLQQERMIKAEGGFLLGSVVLGGLCLVLVLWQMQRQNDKIRMFFSVFTHEIKTSLARLILKTDLIAEEYPNEPSLVQLKEETVFLQNQLENALWVAKGFGKLFSERVNWLMLVRDFEWSLPSLRWQYKGEPFAIKIDRRLMQMILRNIVQNAIVHGQATELQVRAEQNLGDWQMWIEDNGRGFKGDLSILGESMERVAASSGSGIGLWVVKQGVHQLHGKVEFYSPSTGGFGVHLIIPKGSVE